MLNLEGSKTRSQTTLLQRFLPGDPCYWPDVLQAGSGESDEMQRL